MKYIIKNNFVLFCASTVIFLSILSLIGWFFNIEILASYSISYIPMAPSTATNFILLSIIILSIRYGQNTKLIEFITNLIIAILFLLLSIILLNHILNSSFKIENFIFAVHNKTKLLVSNPTGYMSLITAFIFIYLLSLIMAFKLFKNNIKHSNIINISAIIGFLFNFTFFLGYLYNLPFFYETNLIPLAFPTVICFLLSFSTMINISIKNSLFEYYFLSNTTHAKILRVIVPITLALLMLKDILEKNYILTYKTSFDILLLTFFLIIFYIVLISTIVITTNKIGKSIDSYVKEKEVLLLEVHHRVKNNLNTIVGLLTLQYYRSKNNEVKEQLSITNTRIYTMASIHQQIYQSDNYESINFDKLVPMLINNIKKLHLEKMNNIDIKFNVNNFTLDVNKAIPCALILNEIICNSIKHAFTNIKEPQISINLFSNKNQYVIEIGDNGIGVSDDWNIQKNGNLGLELITSLASQLSGKILTKNLDGLKYEIIF